MIIRQLVPTAEDLTVKDILAPFEVPTASPSMPFDDDAISLAVALGRRLSTDREARRQPALQALAFWMRKAELLRLRESAMRLEEDGTILVPRGTVFHLPPANVDTLFVYSWLLALLAGNRNIVRLSSRGSGQAELLVRVVNEVLTEHAGSPAADGTVMLSYGRDAVITGALSAVCDVRVIWGGDTTVHAVRKVPLPARAIELAFPDRYSFAAIDAMTVLGLEAPALAELADKFYNDTYWFDQLGCSSPRVVAWVGEASAHEAAARFALALHSRIQARGYHVDVGTALAIDTPVTAVHWVANELAIIDLDNLDGLGRDHPGGGTMFQVCIPSLDSLAQVLTARDQTLSHFGFSREVLVGFVRRLGARAFDRLVPMGTALQFNRMWDGFDLIAQFTRHVSVVGSDK